MREAPLPADPAAALDLPTGLAVPHSAILHRGDGLPIQQELRWLRPGYAPGYLDQDYRTATTFAHLLRRWTSDHRHGHGTTAGFEALAEQLSGQDLASFFDAWLHQPTQPAATADNGL